MLDPGNLGTFVRRFKNQTFYFTNGELTYKSINYQKKYIPAVSNSIEFSYKVITMDLETYNDGGVLTPYCISLYDGKSFKFFYYSDYNSADELIRGAIKYLMQRRYNGYRVYMHNFSKFDGVFIVKYLPEFSDRVNIIVRGTDIIKVNFPPPYRGGGKICLILRGFVLNVTFFSKKTSPDV